MPLSEEIISQLRQILGADHVLTSGEDLIPYCFDGTAALRQRPGCVVFARNREQVVDVLKLANDQKLPDVTRG